MRHAPLSQRSESGSTHGVGESRTGCQTRDHPRLVAPAGRTEVRWFEAPFVSGSTEHRQRGRAADRADGERELRLGLGPDLRRAGQSRAQGLGPDGRKRSAAAWHRTCSETSQTTAWKDFIASHMAVLAGMDFFTAEVLTWRGLTTYYVLFVIHLETRRVTLAGITPHPNEGWMEQIARNLTDADSGALLGQRYLLHDRDTKFCAGFRSTLRAGGLEPVRLPPSSPDLNAFAERWVRSVKEECLSKLILFGEPSLRRALNEYVAHFHFERNHQGKGNRLLFPEPVAHGSATGSVDCRTRLGGLLRYYARAA